MKYFQRGWNTYVLVISKARKIYKNPNVTGIKHVQEAKTRQILSQTNVKNCTSIKKE